MPKIKPIISWTPSLYDRLSKYYDRFAKWLFPIGDRGREEVLSDLKSGKILDVACGTGTLLNKADQSGFNCFGIDTSLGMLLETKKKAPTALVVQASFYALPFPEDHFDYVLETNAVSGTEIDPKSVLSEMLRVCKEEGELRLGDYGNSGRKGKLSQALINIGILFGDYPHNYKELFNDLGYKAQIEDLGWGGMYQYIRVLKEWRLG
jgi:ubiquinone/menaquinone biosynthesis C-methylase UbiE